MDPQVLTARRIVLAIIAFAMSMPMVVITTFHIGRNQERLPQQIVRFVLTLVLCTFLFRGANWARWVAVILFLVAGTAELVEGVVLLSDGTHGLILIATGSVCLASAAVLFFVPVVRAYFNGGSTSIAKTV